MLDPHAEERAKVIEFDRQLTESFHKARTERMDAWFAKHPEAKYFEPSYEEDIAETKSAEWHWYFWQYLKQKPEKRYQDKKRQVYGFGHCGIDGGPDDRECKRGCRFYPAECRIGPLSIEVLHHYEKYQGFKETLEAWEAAAAE